MMTASTATRLIQRIQSRDAQVGVIGLGYVGLPLLVEFARSGFTAVGLDVMAGKVDMINRGYSYIPDVPSSDIGEMIAARRLSATTDMSAIETLDCISICVPTPLRKTKDPDMSYIVAAVESIASRIHPGMLIVLESTTYPGTTEELVQPLLERTGLKAGVDFFLAFSPERVDPGNSRFHTRNVPKVVGGVTPACADVAAALYGKVVDTIVPVSSTRVAEMVKLLENTFRAVNIGLVNEIALMCERLNVDAWEVVDAAATKPFGFMPFYPGPGLGGHCIPIDPFYLSWKAKQAGFEPRFIELAGHVNASMPHAVVEKIGQALNVHRKPVNGSRLVIAGVTYKANIDDIRESPALDVMALLDGRGAHVSFVDPFVDMIAARDWGGGHDLRTRPLDRATFAEADCVVILADHRAFNYDELAEAAPLIVDTRNAIKHAYPHVFRLGMPNALAPAVDASELLGVA
jgi:UDP-N-acetyl-D-glucosamine dehydrogenase